MKTYSVPPKLEKHLKRNDRFWKNIMKKKKVIGFLTVALAFFLLGIIGKSCWDGYWRTHSWRFQSPVIFQTPLIIKEIKPQAQKMLSPVGEVNAQSMPEIKPYLTEQELALSKPHGALLWKMFQRESGKGKYDVCRSSGKGFNGLGLGESDDYIREHGANCFATTEALWNRAERLIVDLGVDKHEGKAVCRWKYGGSFNQPNCEYYQEVLASL